MTKIEHLGNIDKGCVVLWQCKVQNGIKSFGVYNFVYETWYLHLLKDRYYQNLNFDKKKKTKEYLKVGIKIYCTWSVMAP